MAHQNVLELKSVNDVPIGLGCPLLAIVTIMSGVVRCSGARGATRRSFFMQVCIPKSLSQCAQMRVLCPLCRVCIALGRVLTQVIWWDLIFKPLHTAQDSCFGLGEYFEVRVSQILHCGGPRYLKTSVHKLDRGTSVAFHSTTVPTNIHREFTFMRKEGSTRLHCFRAWRFAPPGTWRLEAIRFVSHRIKLHNTRIVLQEAISKRGICYGPSIYLVH